MVILTIKFPTGTKTYDYLMKNPHGYKLNKEKSVKFFIGCSKMYGVEYNSAILVSAKKVDTLPAHVTTELEIMTDNYVRAFSISPDTLKSLRTPKTPPPPPPPPEGEWKEVVVTKEAFVKSIGYKSYYQLSWELRQKIESGNYIRKIRTT